MSNVGSANCLTKNHVVTGQAIRSLVLERKTSEAEQRAFKTEASLAHALHRKVLRPKSRFQDLIAHLDAKHEATMEKLEVICKLRHHTKTI